jgi:serine protease
MKHHGHSLRATWLYAATLAILVLALLPGCTRPRPRLAVPEEEPSATPVAAVTEVGSPAPATEVAVPLPATEAATPEPATEPATPAPPTEAPLSPVAPATESPTTSAEGAEDIFVEPALTIGDQPDVVPGQIVVKLEPQPAMRALVAEPGADGIIATGVDNIDRLNQEFGVTGFDPLLEPIADASGVTVRSMAGRRPAIMGIYVVSYTDPTDPATVAAAYQAEPNVIYAEPNYYVYASATRAVPLAFTPNDPYFERQWNLQAIQAPQAWDISGGQGVIVAVVDSGVAYEDFEQYRRAPDLAQTNFVPGYDFVNNDPHANDDFGHGTHVAGTIAQSTNNGRGVAGVAFGASIMPIKVLDARGQGGFDALAQGIIFAADHGARVINLSLSGRKTSQLMTDAIAYATGKGALIVAAAGNSGGDVEYPAAYPEVLAVGSVEYQLQRAGYANFGPQIDIVAPGGDTRADANGDGQPDGILQETFKGADPTRFALYYLEGTSMAAPHVSAVAALLFAVSPSASAIQVRQAIEATARDLGPAGRDNDFGYGLVQAAAALALLSPPEPPTSTPAPPTDTPSPTTTHAVTDTPTRVLPSPTDTATVVAPPPTDTVAAPSPTPPAPGASPTPLPAGPTATPVTPTPPATTTPVATGGEELIVNGGFEGEGGWVFSQTAVPAGFATEVVHSGQRSARLGIVSGYDLYSYSSVHQTITIPAGIKRAMLTYWTYPISQDVYPNDLQLVLILDQHFRLVASADQSLSNARQWVPGAFDLTQFAGQTITVYFGVYNNGVTGRTTAMYLDDVTVTVER